MYDALVSENGPPLRWFCEECDESWKKSSTPNLMSTLALILDKTDQVEIRLGSEVGEIGRRLQNVEGKTELVSDTVNIKLDDLEQKLVGLADTLEKSTEVHVKAKEACLGITMVEGEETIHKRLKDKVDDMIKVIGTQQSDAAKILEGAIKMQAEETREEEEEKRKRKVNAIVHGLMEPQAMTATYRENEDKDSTEKLLHLLSCDTVSADRSRDWAHHLPPIRQQNLDLCESRLNQSRLGIMSCIKQKT